MGVDWHEHDVGVCATIGITWDGSRDAPWDYIGHAEIALQRFDGAVAWSEPFLKLQESPDEKDDSVQDARDPDSYAQHALFDRYE